MTYFAPIWADVMYWRGLEIEPLWALFTMLPAANQADYLRR